MFRTRKHGSPRQVGKRFRVGGPNPSTNIEPHVRTFSHPKNPIIRTREGHTVEFLGGQTISVDGRKTTPQELKHDNGFLFDRVKKICQRMGTVQSAMGQQTALPKGFEKYDAIVAFQEL